MSDEFEPRWWSWADIVRHADRLGIPNFQRGAVWDTSNRVALLESIYEQSPCGSFVLWAPAPDDRDSQRHGVPLRGFGEDVEPMWLVDGQQRTRAMLDTFQQLLQTADRADSWSLVRASDLADLRGLGSALVSDTDEDDDDNDEDAEVESHPWLVVLPAMRAFHSGEVPYFGRHSESRNVRRGSMFRRLRPRARTRLNADGKLRPVPPLPVGTIPLATLLSRQSVFAQDHLSKVAAEALRSFLADRLDDKVLDDLLPWGPQFVTGHAFESPGHDHQPASPMRWPQLFARRGEAEVHDMVGRLEGLFSDEWATVRGRFAGMLDGNRFAVGWLPPSDVSAAIDAYVRINRAGIRVRAEERALALLSRARPDLLNDLAEFTRRRDGGWAIENQRALLSHQSDRQMGFAVWMTLVTRYATLALLGDYARRWLGLSAIDKDTFGYRLDRVGAGETDTGRKTWARNDYEVPDDVIRDCANRATPALLLVDSVLSEEVCLDHRMARQSARALYPLLDLFYRVPSCELERLRKDRHFRLAIARLLHWALLAPYIDQPDFEQLIVDVHGINEEVARKESAPIPVWGGDSGHIGQMLRAAFARYQASLRSLWHRKHEEIATRQERSPVEVDGLPDSVALGRLAIDAFASEVRNARSLQHPSVGWLYALERRGGASEFSWRAQAQGYLETEGRVGVPPATSESRECMPLAAADEDGSLYPEKQHIVPFAIARQIVDKGGTRATASPSNAIGNLTWLSRRQNGLDALSDRWTVMSKELDESNLRSRGLLAPAGGDEAARSVFDLYHRLREVVLDGSWRANQARAQDLYAAFCDGRASWLVDEMKAWLEQPLPRPAAAWLGEPE